MSEFGLCFVPMGVGVVFCMMAFSLDAPPGEVSTIFSIWGAASWITLMLRREEPKDD